MPVVIEGNYQKPERVVTGLYSFDHALSNKRTGDIGYPTKSIIEVYGSQGVGKSTLTYFLAGRRSTGGRILICDLEGLDPDYLPVAVGTTGFDGTIEIIDSVEPKGKKRTHEEMINELTDRTLYEEEINVGILDSVGAILPVFENESEIGEGFGAKRAVIVAQFSRKATYTVNNKETQPNLFVVNHSHMAVGGGYGHHSAGGVALSHLGVVRLFLRYSTKDFIKSGDDILAYVVEGTVEKLRYGGKGRKFKIAYVPGWGVRPNLTAMIDCVDLGIADRKATVKIGDQSFGYISKMVEEDLSGNDDFFAPFHEALKNYKEE
jgi:RecA/RadA recombinase